MKPMQFNVLDCDVVFEQELHSFRCLKHTMHDLFEIDSMLLNELVVLLSADPTIKDSHWFKILLIESHTIAECLKKYEELRG